MLLADIGAERDNAFVIDQQHGGLVAAEQVLATIQDLFERRLGIGH